MNEPMHLEICFLADGGTKFYPTGNGKALAVRLAAVVKMFNDRPALILCAAGACGSHEEETPEAHA